MKEDPAKPRASSRGPRPEGGTGEPPGEEGAAPGLERPFPFPRPHRPRVHVDPDPLVTAVLPDAQVCAPANVWTARGYPGPHCAKTHLRLYLTLDLDEWLEIPRNAVRHVVQCDGGCAALGGVVLWIDRKADVQHTRTRPVEPPTGTFRSSPRPDWAGGDEGESDWPDPGTRSKYCG